MAKVNGYKSSSMLVDTLNSLELTTWHCTCNKNNDSFLTEFIIGFQLQQIKSNNYNSYLPEKEAHSFHDPIFSVCVSPYKKFCPTKILKLFSLPPTGIAHTLERSAQNAIFVCICNLYAMHAISCTNLVVLISLKRHIDCIYLGLWQHFYGNLYTSLLFSLP